MIETRSELQTSNGTFTETLMTKTHSERPVLVIGAGLAGLTCAVALNVNHIPVILVSPHLPKEINLSKLETCDLYGSGRTTALLQASCYFLKKTGIWEKVKHYATPLEIMRLIGEPGQARPPIEVSFSPQEIFDPALKALNSNRYRQQYLSDTNQKFEFFGYNLSNSLLASVLFEHLKENSVPIYQARLVGLEQSPHCVNIRCQSLPQLENGKSEVLQLKGSLLVAADGANSKVRTLCRIPYTKHTYDQYALTLIIKHSKPHKNISTEFQKLSGPLTLVPLEEQTSSVVWSKTGLEAGIMMQMSKEHIIRQLEFETHGILGKIELVSGPNCFPVTSLRVKKLFAPPRVALIAEAAHSMPPIAAQGLNTSFMDIAHLTALIIEGYGTRQGIQPERLLSLYEKKRQSDIKRRFAAVNMLNQAVVSQSFILNKIKTSALEKVRDHRLLRSILINEGMMQQKDLPSCFH